MTTVTLYNVRTLLKERTLTICPEYDYGVRYPTQFFYLSQPITVQLSDGYCLEIPSDYRTDLSSSPRWLWSVAAPYGPFLLAAIIHDWLYSTNYRGDRHFADREMLLWSVAINVNQTDNYLRYKAVQWFGGRWWRRAGRRLAREAEARVLGAAH